VRSRHGVLFTVTHVSAPDSMKRDISADYWRPLLPKVMQPKDEVEQVVYNPESAFIFLQSYATTPRCFLYFLNESRLAADKG
jgi:hypothetical protein